MARIASRLNPVARVRVRGYRCAMQMIPTEDVTGLPLGPLRWRERRHRHRPAGEPFRPERHGVEIVQERDARPFVERHHYAGTWVAARLSVGLYRCPRTYHPGALWGAELVGVCVFGVPMQGAVVPRYAPGRAPHEGVELARLVLLDHVEGNAESWFVRRALNMLGEALPEVRTVISYSDPVVRRRADGTGVLPGHIGTVYKSLGARYFGRSKSKLLKLGPDGRALSDRALSKIRLDEVGARYAEMALVASGAPVRHAGETGADYVRRALDEGPFRCLRHPGNHAYGWSLDGLPLAEAQLGGAPVRRGSDGVATIAEVLPWGI